MPIHTTYTQARANLAKLCDKVSMRATRYTPRGKEWSDGARARNAHRSL